MISDRESEEQTEIISFDDHREQLVQEFVQASINKVARNKRKRRNFANHRLLTIKRVANNNYCAKKSYFIRLGAKFSKNQTKSMTENRDCTT